MVRWVVGGWLIAGSALLAGAPAWAASASTGATGETGDTGGSTTGGTTYGTDFGTTPCEDCVSLSESVGEAGGSPCDSGCASSGPRGGLSALGALSAVAAAIGVRRRARA